MSATSGGRRPGPETWDRLEALIGAMLAQPGTRLPGLRRLDGRARAAGGQIEVDAKLLGDIEALAR